MTTWTPGWRLLRPREGEPLSTFPEDFNWKISQAKLRELDNILWGKWPRAELHNTVYYIILQYSIEDIQRQCYAHKRLYPKQPYYVPIPIPKKGVYAFDPYVDIILDVIQYIHHDPSTSLLQIATGTERRFYEHFGATRNENLNLQLKSQVDRVLWVLEQWTLIKMDFCEEERQRIQHLPIVELFLQGAWPNPRTDLIPEVELLPSKLDMVNLLRLSNFEIEWTSDPTRHLHMPTKSKLCLFYLASFARAQCVSADRGHTFSLHNLLEIPSKLFDEIIQSYQLLFDSYSLSSVQTYHSLTTSPKLPPFYQTTTSTETQQSLRDIYLDIICGLTIISPPPKSKPRCVRLERQRFKNPMRRGSRQDKIWTAKDFTYLRSRLIFLQRRAVDKKPIGLPQLWGYDKRSLQWYTFWTLAFTAVLGIMQLVVGTLQAMK